jgi:hypothetical protein
VVVSSLPVYDKFQHKPHKGDKISLTKDEPPMLGNGGREPKVGYPALNNLKPHAGVVDGIIGMSKTAR